MSSFVGDYGVEWGLSREGLPVVLVVAVVVAVVVYAIARRHGGGARGQNLSVFLRTAAGRPIVVKGGGLSVRWQLLKVATITTTSHNTKLFQLEVPEGLPSKLPIGKHVSVGLTVKGEKVMRPYTPISAPESNTIDLLVKRYNMGALTTAMWNVRVGDLMAVKGPIGNYKHKGCGRYIMVGGGTGLTPLLQVAQYCLEGWGGVESSSEFSLLYQNREECDILLRKELTDLAEKHKGRFTVTFFLSRAPEGWEDSAPKGSACGRRAGYVEKKDFEAAAGSAAAVTDSDTHYLICGSSSFQDAYKGTLDKMGVSGDSITVF